MKVVIGIDGSIGKIFKYLRYSPAYILFNNLSGTDSWTKLSTESPKDTIVKFAENIPKERHLYCLCEFAIFERNYQ